MMPSFSLRREVFVSLIAFHAGSVCRKVALTAFFTWFRFANAVTFFYSLPTAVNKVQSYPMPVLS